MDLLIATTLLEGTAQSLARRQEAITMVKRTVRHVQDTVFFQTCASMAIPVIYAHWEGFVREVFQRYLDCIEKSGLACIDLSPHLLAYSWSPEFQSLQGKAGTEQRAQFARRILEATTKKVAFGRAEKDIDTKSNLNFDVFEDLCTRLCLAASALIDCKRALNALVNKRNTIAHGGRHDNVKVDEIDDAAALVMDLMTRVEAMIQDATNRSTFLST